MSRIARDRLLGLLPHSGAMCLLDAVEAWDAAGITCLSHRYAAADNPLRRADGRLGAACAIEIAAQAMAVHGRLVAPEAAPPRPGLLVSLRDVRLRAATFPAGGGPLTITARRLMGDGRGATYAFAVSAADGDGWASGRATVLFEAPL
jgi:predicted hotdog family 3-hydroxylacyl-ACP dehydratase